MSESLLSYEEELAQREVEKFETWKAASIARIPPRYRGAEPSTREPGTGLYLFGAVGTGKTYEAAGITLTHIAKGIRTRWLTVPMWLQQQRESFNSDTTMDSVDSLTAGGLLVLDDIGVERATPWSLEMLYVLVAEAYNRDTTLVVTGNLTFEQLSDRIGARVVSRLAEVCRPVEMTGRDRRIQRRPTV